MTDALFKGFGEKALPFLKALGFHQTREWFHANKKLYESDVKGPMGDLVEEASSRYAALNIPLSGSRKTSLFRVNRDVRFAKEKHPYNTHASAVLTRSGDKKDTGGTYMHFANGDCFFAGGIWEPPGPELRALREQIVHRSDDFLAIIDDLLAKNYVFETNNMLIRKPPAFKHIEDERLSEWLRRKSLIINKMIDDEAIQKPDILDELITMTEDIMPLLNFAWRAMDPIRQSEEDKKI